MNTFQDYLVHEFTDEYEQGRLSRRDALRYLAAVVGSVALAASILAACTPPVRPAVPPGGPTPTAASFSSDDSTIEARRVEFPGQSATLIGYLAKPTGSGPFPAVLVCHENQGLVEYTRDVTRRLAAAGYVGLAVDLLSRQGGTENTDRARIAGLLGRETQNEQFIQDFQDGLRYLQGQAFVRPDRIGMIGFCFGGGVTWLVATKTPELRAAVPFYGPNPPLQDVSDIQAPVLAIYGEQDRFINPGIPAIEAAMQQHGKTFQKIIYPNADHAFHNNTRTGSYNAEAANDAWAKALDWFERYL